MAWRSRAPRADPPVEVLEVVELVVDDVDVDVTSDRTDIERLVSKARHALRVVDT